jgi:predicted acyltransferase
MTPSGAAIVSFCEFSQGLAVTFDSAAEPHKYQQIQWRAYESVGRTPQYDLLNHNCEHFATWLVNGTPKSSQVVGLGVLALIGLMSVIAS